MKKIEYENRVPISKDNICIKRDNKKCVNCGACKGVCNFRIGVYDHYDMEHADKPKCINCGSCIMVCPYNALSEVLDYKKVINELNKGKRVIFQIAPALRVTLGDEFGLKPGFNVMGKIVTFLNMMGAYKVYDTTFGADLTIIEEGNELIYRLKNNIKEPLFTSCCPAWVKYICEFYPTYKNNLSTSKSPILMLGSVIKNCLYDKDTVVVAVVPCTAKKEEITKTDDVDYAITTRELAMWICEENIDFKLLKNMKVDKIYGTSSGNIFCNSGGVMESIIRYVYYELTKKNVAKKYLNFTSVRGLDDIKECHIKIKDYDLSLAIVNGTGDAKKILDKIKDGKQYDIVEVMACEGGCISGGGNSKKYIPITADIKRKRMNSVYKIDNKSKRRSSYQNKVLKGIYSNYIGGTYGDVAKELLHVKH